MKNMLRILQLSDCETDKLVKIMREHTQLAREAIIDPTKRDEAISKINTLERERIQLIGR